MCVCGSVCLWCVCVHMCMTCEGVQGSESVLGFLRLQIQPVVCSITWFLGVEPRPLEELEVRLTAYPFCWSLGITFVVKYIFIDIMLFYSSVIIKFYLGLCLSILSVL